MHRSKISVIVPMYNVERYLATCLDSILSQNYRNIEVIVINDGSTDFSLEIAEKYAEQDDRVTVYSYENNGLSEARNHGLNLATGEYISFVDSDDILLPFALEEMYKTAYIDNADLVEGKIIKGKTHGDISYNKKYNKKTFLPLEAISNVLYQKLLLPSVCGKLFKRDLFQDLRFQPGILYEDLDIFYRIYEKANKSVWIDFPVYFYRETEGSIIHSWKTQRLDVLKVTDNLEIYIKEKYPELLPGAHDRKLSANFNIYGLCTVNGDVENASLCWDNIRKYRKKSLINPKVRFKNKAGILLSYLGRPIFNLAARKIYR